MLCLLIFQAFLEFADESCAANMVSCHKTNPAQIRLKSCYVEFSTHKELKTDLTNVQVTDRFFTFFVRFEFCTVIEV